MAYKRTAEEALEVIGHAKHKTEEVRPLTQVLFHPTLEQCRETQTDLRLLDVDEQFISRLEQGERFVFRGTGDEKLVLCTENETYEVKEGEISNALVLVPQLLYSEQLPQRQTTHAVVEKKIIAIKNSYLELRPTFPKLRKLRELLTSSAYKGPEEESSVEGGYYICDLLDSVQCSREELLKTLEDMSACCIDNRWYLLDVEYEARILSLIINLAEEKSWTQISRAEASRVLSSQVPQAILDHIFHHFTQPLQITSDDIRAWKPLRLCRSFAEMLLRAGEGKFRYSEFMISWKQCLPQDVEPDMSSLRGLALIEQEGTQQQVVHLFPEYMLPENVSERFRLLFKRKEKWTLQEIEPYIEKLATKGMNVSVMLTKFSRTSTLKGVKVFGARHLK